MRVVFNIKVPFPFYFYCTQISLFIKNNSSERALRFYYCDAGAHGLWRNIWHYFEHMLYLYDAWWVFLILNLSIWLPWSYVRNILSLELELWLRSYSFDEVTCHSNKLWYDTCGTLGSPWALGAPWAPSFCTARKEKSTFTK